MTSPNALYRSPANLVDVVLRMRKDIRKLFRQLNNTTPSGMLGFFAGATAPDGWLICDGTVYNISDYPDLGGYLGSIWGGNGTSTFAVPDFTGGRFPAGVISGGASGTVGGNNAHSHTLSANGSARIMIGVSQIVVDTTGSGTGVANPSFKAPVTRSTATSSDSTAVSAILQGSTDSNGDTRPAYAQFLACIKT